MVTNKGRCILYPLRISSFKYFKYLSSKFSLNLDLSVFPVKIIENSSATHLSKLEGSGGEQIDWRHQGLVRIVMVRWGMVGLLVSSPGLWLFSHLSTQTLLSIPRARFLDPAPSNQRTSGKQPVTTFLHFSFRHFGFKTELRKCQLGVCGSRMRGWEASHLISGKVGIGEVGIPIKVARLKYYDQLSNIFFKAKLPGSNTTYNPFLFWK